MPDSAEARYQLVRGAGLALALLVVLALERFRPHERFRPAWGTNLGLWVIDALAMSALCGACGWVLAAWAAERGLGLLAWAGAGGWIAAGAGVLGLDAVSYVWHRANHRVSWLWRFHQVHHADASFHVTTALRFPRRIDLLLRRALITPALHRGHHVADWRELNTNLGTVLSLWDRLAGTFRDSEPGRRVATELPDWSRPAPPTLAESLLLPFRQPA